MIIHQPEIFELDDHTIIWAKLEYKKPKYDLPEFLWYRIPSEYSEFLSEQTDSFLLPGLLVGMHLGEDIEVRGKVSPLLAYNLDEYQFLLNFRMPNDVCRVAVRYECIETQINKPEKVGMAFSGGVDSMFTLWNHLPQNQPIPDYQVSHAIFIMGFDIVRKKEAKYRQLFSNFHQRLKEYAIELIPMETNTVRTIIPRMRLTNFYSPVLIGCAHILGALLKRFFTSSSRDYINFRIRVSSSDPLADSLLSSDTLDLINHGADSRRVEKILAISEWDFAHQNLQVCTVSNQQGNCSRCEKCLRTMIPIFAINKLDRFATFQKPIRSNKEVLLWAGKLNPYNDYYPEIVPFIKIHRRELIPWIRITYLLGYLRGRAIRLIPELVRTKMHRFGYFQDNKMEKDAFENPELLKTIQNSSTRVDEPSNCSNSH